MVNIFVICEFLTKLGLLNNNCTNILKVKTSFQSLVTNIVMLHLSEIFSQPYSEKWKANKKFAVQALKMFGFGTAAGEKRIQNEVNTVIQFLDRQKGDPVELKQPLAKMAANVICSIIFNQMFDWDDDEMHEFVSLIDDIMRTIGEDALMAAVVADMMPIWMAKIIVRNPIKRMQKVFADLRRYMGKKINEHRATFDPDNLRDTMDVYLRDRSNDPDFNDMVILYYIIIHILS